MMLKMPIEIELDVLGLPPTRDHQIEEQEFFSRPEDSGATTVISEVDQADLYGDVRILSSQLVGQLDQGCQVFYTEPQTQHEQDNSGIYEQDTAAKRECLNTLALEEGFAAIQSHTPSLKNKSTGNVLDLLDSFNDGLAYVINAMGAILRLGKLVNYSWEGMVKRQ